ncbi:GerW family sporulation protein [Caloramator sp. ALD01]|uniref:GerW family sporulation protein n=1 Tax=Caloramator sp. ALD01 TaxID=1031288 RepID=UPI00041525C8|nr:GerW family sporulation protein [Caloramator sp. ALD01]
MAEHPIEGLMRTTMDNLKKMIDVNTIVGEPVETKDGKVIIPISKVSMGFVSGGSEFKQSDSDKNNSSYPFGGGSGAGVSVQPIAFLVVGEDVRLLPATEMNYVERLLDNVPELLKDLIKNFKKKKENKEDENFNPS